MGYHRKHQGRAAAEAAKLPLYHLGRSGPLPRGAYVALVPGAQVTVLAPDLPPSLKGRAREVVARRQMADLFGRSELDFELRPLVLGAGKSHLSVGKAHLGVGKAQWRRVLAVAPAERQKWLERLTPACRAVLPDYMALPWAPDIWTVETADGQIRARLGGDDGFTAEPGLALVLLQSALLSAKPTAVLLLGAEDPDIARLLKIEGLETSEDPGRYGAGIFTHGELALDLMRDPGAENRDMRRALRPLVWPVVMAVLALGLWAGAVARETYELRAQALAHRKGAERILRDTMIPAGPILDMRVQVSQLIERRRGTVAQAGMKARPMDIFRKAGGVLADSGAQVLAVSYQAGSGLVMDLRARDFAALDQLVAALRGAGIELSVAQSTARENEGVEASLALVSNRASGGGAGQ